jgi:hypothetical protein
MINDAGFKQKGAVTMHRIISCVAVLAFAMAVAAPTYAATHKHKLRLIPAKADPPPHRVCDWIGPGGRAVYRCTIVD